MSEKGNEMKDLMARIESKEVERALDGFYREWVLNKKSKVTDPPDGIGPAEVQNKLDEVVMFNLVLIAAASKVRESPENLIKMLGATFVIGLCVGRRLSND